MAQRGRQSDINRVQTLRHATFAESMPTSQLRVVAGDQVHPSRFSYNAGDLLLHSTPGFLITCTMKRELSATKEASTALPPYIQQAQASDRAVEQGEASALQDAVGTGKFSHTTLTLCGPGHYVNTCSNLKVVCFVSCCIRNIHMGGQQAKSGSYKHSICIYPCPLLQAQVKPSRSFVPSRSLAAALWSSSCQVRYFGRAKIRI